MKLSDKIVGLRKSNGMSQEDLAEKLDVSRQAISRWESGAAMPDANNILQLSKLFDVTTDYLLNDDYQSDNDLPKIKEVQNDRMAHAPADTPAVSLQIPVLTGGCTNHRRQTLCNRWFFSNHQLHNLQPPIHSANYQTVFLQCCVLRQV